MRKLSICVVSLTVLLLAACGDDDNGGATQSDTTQEETTSSSNEGTEAPAADDLSAALLTAEDLPSGATVEEIDVAALLETLEQPLENEKIEPAECEERPSLFDSDTEAVGMRAIVGEAQNIGTFNMIVSADISSDFVTKQRDFIERCPEFSISGTIPEQQLEVSEVRATSEIEPPSIEVDDIIAFEQTTSISGGTPIPATGIYMSVDGYGISLVESPPSDTFDINALAETAVERLRSATS